LKRWEWVVGGREGGDLEEWELVAGCERGERVRPIGATILNTRYHVRAFIAISK
jgi:hypothetical protein